MSASTIATNAGNSHRISVENAVADVVKEVDCESISCFAITQDSTDTTTTAKGQALSQDTITSVEFDDSQQEQSEMIFFDTNANDGASISGLVRPVANAKIPCNEEVVTVTKTTHQHALLPPPLLVKCPNVQDVLFPMEGYIMWPGNIYCNTLLEQYRLEFFEATASDRMQDRAQIILQIMQHIISDQQQSLSEDQGSNSYSDGGNDIGGGRFLKAIHIPNRSSPKQQQTTVGKPSDKENGLKNIQLLEIIINSNNPNVILTKTIWEVMNESDVLIELSKLLIQSTKRRDSNIAIDVGAASGMSDAKSSLLQQNTIDNEESQISTSYMAILQGLYYVPNYYPTRRNNNHKGPHEYDSDGETVVTSYSSSENSNDFDGRGKKRRLVHKKSDDVRSTSSIGNRSSRRGIRLAKNNDNNHTPPGYTDDVARLPPCHQQQPVKVSMIGRILVNGDTNETDEGCSSQVSAAFATISTSMVPANDDNDNNTNNTIAPLVNNQYRPKSMKSQLAMLEQEGSDDLPKGVTVRPSGKWQAQTYFAGQSRYVGVYDTSRLAARAYNVVQDYLHVYRNKYKITKDSPKEKLAAVFAEARRVADEAVQRLRTYINMEESVGEGAHKMTDAQLPFENNSTTNANAQPDNSNTGGDGNTTEHEAITLSVNESHVQPVDSSPP